MKNKSVMIGPLTYEIIYQSKPSNEIQALSNIVLHIFDRLSNIETEVTKLKTKKRKKKT